MLENASQIAKHTYPKIQMEILNIFTRNMQSQVHNEIDDAKFSLIANEACDKSKRE